MSFSQASEDTFEQLKNALPQDSSSLRATSECERGCIIGLKEGGWANRRIARHMGRSDVAIRRYWQEWVDSGRFHGHDSSGRPKAKAGQEDRFTVR
ncbi:HTH_Tnp_Tc3_2 domain-containing protein [Trichonephila clavipes]|nr:HTH_Tnp_Tc3_2 domain-containing protein [Trichonephila clavipes]